MRQTAHVVPYWVRVRTHTNAIGMKKKKTQRRFSHIFIALTQIGFCFLCPISNARLLLRSTALYASVCVQENGRSSWCVYKSAGETSSKLCPEAWSEWYTTFKQCHLHISSSWMPRKCGKLSWGSKLQVIFYFCELFFPSSLQFGGFSDVFLFFCFTHWNTTKHSITDCVACLTTIYQ